MNVPVADLTQRNGGTYIVRCYSGVSVPQARHQQANTLAVRVRPRRPSEKSATLGAASHQIRRARTSRRMLYIGATAEQGYDRAGCWRVQHPLRLISLPLDPSSIHHH